MSSPGQKRGTWGHVMALFDSHKKCARCREKGVGDDPCVKKLDCQICKAFTPPQVQQLATPTYKSRKERGEQKKSTSESDATQPPLGVPGTNAVQEVCKSATRPVQGPGTSDVATQPLQAPGAGTATQPIQAPGAGPEVLPTGIDSTQLNQPLPGVRTDEFASESDSEAEMDREPVSPASANAQGELPEDSTDQDLSEEANHRETIRGVRSFMGWHRIPDFDSASSSLDDNPFASVKANSPPPPIRSSPGG